MKLLPDDAYGLLLTFDGYDASPDACADPDLLHSVLLQLPGHIGMRRLGEPYVIGVDEPGIRGLSGFTFIMESHISIHTYEERGFITADVYSCKPFDTIETARFLTGSFGIRSFEITEVVRGLRFGHTPRPLRPPRLS